jgi:hypothetical protein
LNDSILPNVLLDLHRCVVSILLSSSND